MNIGEYLRIARANANLRQIDVKDKTKINNKSLSNWEKDVSYPNPEDLKTLAKLYNVSIDELIGNEDPALKSLDLTDIISQPFITFDGNIYELTANDRDKIRMALKLVFFDAKKKTS